MYAVHRKLAVYTITASMLIGLSTFPASAEEISGVNGGSVVEVDFGKPSGPPLLKKFAMYNAGLVPMSNYERDIDKIVALNPEHLRVD